MAEQEKKLPGAELTDNQLDQVTGGEGDDTYCTCESPVYYTDVAKKRQYCYHCGKPRRQRIDSMFD